MKYKRILLKMSGESLMGEKQFGIDPEMLGYFAEEIKEAYTLGAEIAIVIGGGNIFRGLKGNNYGIDRVQGDYMGMLATVINSLALQDILKQKGIDCKLLSGLQISPICEPMSSQKAIEYLQQRKIVIISGGTGNPFFTTDTASALRAVEIKANVILKGTRVDGVYTADPEKDPTAKRYDKVSFKEVYEKKLNIMDLTAFTLCSDNQMPIIVFDMNKKGNLKKVVLGENVGTLVS